MTEAKPLGDREDFAVTPKDVRRTLEDTLGITVTNVLFANWLTSKHGEDEPLSPTQLKGLRTQLHRLFGDAGDTLYELIRFEKEG